MPSTGSSLHRLWSYVGPPWSRRRAWNLACAALAAVPGVRRYVLSTTAIKDHPMWDVTERARHLGQPILDHPAGCFWGSFAEAYENRWHIPYGVDCKFDHGDNPIQLEAPTGVSS